MESLAIQDRPMAVVSVENQLKTKLRSSCDACGVAKIKCDRNQPSCGRCTVMRVSCVYGVSQKHGKPPRKKLRTDALRTNLSTSNSPGSQNTIEGNLSGDQEAQQNTRIEHIPAIVPDVSNSTHLPSGVSSTSGLEAGLFDPGFFMPFSLESWPNYEGNFDTNVQQQASLERRPQDLSVRPSPRSHDCARDSSEILQTLNSPVPFTDITAETVLTHFPHILRVNQDAIRRLTELLECPCARKPHLVMLHASMISRIFLWYQHCACANAQRWSEWPKAKSKASSEASNATSVSEDSEPAVIACGMLPAPASSMSADDPTVSIGGYTISDPCVHIVFRDQLIGIELKNLGALIDLFLSRRAGDDAGSVPSLIESLGTWLKTEHARTLKLLKEALRAFNDNIIT